MIYKAPSDPNHSMVLWFLYLKKSSTLNFYSPFNCLLPSKRSKKKNFFFSFLLRKFHSRNHHWSHQCIKPSSAQFLKFYLFFSPLPAELSPFQNSQQGTFGGICLQNFTISLTSSQCCQLNFFQTTEWKDKNLIIFKNWKEVQSGATSQDKTRTSKIMKRTLVIF